MGSIAIGSLVTFRGVDRKNSATVFCRILIVAASTYVPSAGTLDGELLFDLPFSTWQPHEAL